jgi:flagellar basal-body rod protein FlgC
MGLFDAIDASASGLSAERMRMDVVAENLANAQTTKGADGKPYQRKTVVLQETQATGPSFQSVLGGAMNSSRVNGVEVAGIAVDPSAGRRVYDPGHPDADKQGYITLPNVNPVTEMVDLITAQRSYESNVTAMQTAKTMFARTLDILR